MTTPANMMQKYNVSDESWSLGLWGRRVPGFGYYGALTPQFTGMHVEVNPELAYRMADNHPRPQRARELMADIERVNIGKFPWQEVRVALAAA